MNFINFLKSKVFLRQIILAIIVLIVLVFLLMKWLKVKTNHGEFIVVPDLSKKSVVEVRNVIDEHKLRFEVVDSANYNPDYPRFSVTEQNPLAGTKVKENRKIYIKINPANYKSVSVPDVVQKTRRNAESMLIAVGLEVGNITYIDELGKDVVYYIKYKAKDIKPGEKVPKTSKIDLVCGNGGEGDKLKEAIIRSQSKEENTIDDDF